MSEKEPINGKKPKKQTENDQTILKQSQDIQSDIENLTDRLMNFTFDQKRIEELLSEVSIQPNIEKALFLAKKQRVDVVYHAAALEDNPFTLPEVQTLLEGITVGGHKLSDESQVLNLDKAWKHTLDLIRDQRFELEKQTICEIHKLVAKEEALEWGQFRSGGVTISGTQYRPPEASKLDQIFEKGCENLQQIENPILKAMCYFLMGALNQFFYDGNKRTSRITANAMLISKGYPVFNILAKDKLAFNKTMIEFYDTQEGTKALEFFIPYYLEMNKGLGFGY
ncbi:Fic family protein [Terasakiella sp. SH-1]|uniref:Fic family protein n=1 Tax=Terasakiella sp. SH-1 TaxID=2560057 RepID=UPI0010749323|nr:Fic family protein [Terasakiella sp. SH-1]